MACIPAWPPLTKHWACSKQNSCKIWERIIAGQVYASENSLRQTANWSPRRLRDTGCLQRLRAWGSDAWRSWSQLRSRRVVLLREGEKLCNRRMLGREEVHSDLLAPKSGQCDAHVCGGLGGPAFACDVTGEGCGRPHSCGRTNGTGYTDTWARQLERWYCRHSHTSCRKTEFLECFIMEHLLTATKTFSNDDCRNANIYTCNNNGCHEPQQIDCILSSDNSLRSRTFDSSATASDHWGLTATISSKRGKTPGKGTRGNLLGGNDATDHIG